MKNVTEKTANAFSNVKPISLTNASGEITDRAVIVVQAALGGTLEEIKALSRPQGFWFGINQDLGYGYTVNDGIFKLTFPEGAEQTAENIGVKVRMPQGKSRFLTAAEGLEVIRKAKENKRYTAATTAEQVALALDNGVTTEEALNVQEEEQTDNTDEAAATPTSKKGKGKRK